MSLFEWWQALAIEWQYPWVILALPLPWLMVRLSKEYKQPGAALFVPFYDRIIAATGSHHDSGDEVKQRNRWQTLALYSTWLALILSLARPVLLAQPIVTKSTARDLMVAIDLSQSMEQQDYSLKQPGEANGYKVSRITALRQLLLEFAQQRQGDRLGLIVFGSGAYLQVPFTADIELWQQLLQQMDTRLAGPATAIGDAIGLSIRAFADSNTKQKLLLLVTDGSDTSSRLDPIDAARVASIEGIQVYTLGMGDKNTQGDDKVDFVSLEKIAAISNGKSYVASDSETLAQVLADINQLVPAQYQQTSYQPKIDLYAWLMGPVLSFYILVWLGLSARQYWRSRQQEQAHVE